MLRSLLSPCQWSRPLLLASGGWGSTDHPLFLFAFLSNAMDADASRLSLEQCLFVSPSLRFLLHILFPSLPVPLSFQDSFQIHSASPFPSPMLSRSLLSACPYRCVMRQTPPHRRSATLCLARTRAGCQRSSLTCSAAHLCPPLLCPPSQSVWSRSSEWSLHRCSLRVVKGGVCVCVVFVCLCVWGAGGRGIITG